MAKDIERCESCKMCDTIISLHERIKTLESAAVEIYGRLLPQQATQQGQNTGSAVGSKDL